MLGAIVQPRPASPARPSKDDAAAGPLVALQAFQDLFSRGRYRHAAEAARRAVRRDGLDPDLGVRLRLAEGQALWMAGQVGAAQREVRALAEAACSELTHARVEETLAVLALKEHRLEEALARAGAAEEAAIRHRSPAGLLRALEVRSRALVDAGRNEEALLCLRRRIGVAAEGPLVPALAAARSDRGRLLALLGRWTEARRELLQAAALFRSISDPQEFTRAGVGRAMVEIAQGNLLAARQALQRAREAAEEGNPWAFAEALVFTSDLHLAAGAAEQAERSATQALGAFARLRDVEGIARSRVRLAHALMTQARAEEAAGEARRALQAAPAARSDLGALVRVALGRALLRVDRGEAALLFVAAEDLATARPGHSCAARFGGALARGAEDDEVAVALAQVQEWGDRRLLAYCLADAREIRGRPTSLLVSGGAGTVRELAEAAPSITRCVDGGQAMADAAVAMLEDGPWLQRWADALRALRRAVAWRRAAWVADPGWELREDFDQPRPLPPHDLARELAARREGLVPLLRDPYLCGSPARVLHGLAFAVVAPVSSAATLYLDFGEEGDEPGERELGIVRGLARLLSHHPLDAVRDEESPAFPEMVGRCPAVRAVFRDLACMAVSDETVHITGETGTGKEKVARALHERSRRGAGPFVAMNASSVADELLESELFGHARGAFTGAVAAREGYAAAAEGGTLFIDEVTDLTPRAQAKLLRFVQEREYRRVGENAVRRADLRIVTASNMPLEPCVLAGRFRSDLMYRLNGLVLALPPLRERGEDIVLLARHFLRVAALREGRTPPALPATIARALERYDWPGNIRELEHEMRRLAVFSAGGPLQKAHLSARILAPVAAVAPQSLRAAVHEFERGHVGRVLEQHGGSRVRAAAALGLSRQALFLKLKRLGLSAIPPRPGPHAGGGRPPRAEAPPSGG